MTENTYLVPDMSCSHCAQAIRAELLAVAGVESVAVDLETKHVTVRGSALDDLRLETAIEEAGYRTA